jgi:hypothetical protein
MLQEVFHTNGSLCLHIEMPFWYDRNGRRKEITKNNKQTIRRGNGTQFLKKDGSFGVRFVHVTKNPHLQRWFECLRLESIRIKKTVDEWRGSDDVKTDYRVKLLWNLHSLKTDAHNFNEALLDGLEILTGINDRHMYPVVCGKVKTPENTNVFIVVEKMSMDEEVQMFTAQWAQRKESHK